MTKRRPMTEEDWLASPSAYSMLQYLHQHRRISRVPGGQRRHRLFRCACCRLVWDVFEEEACRQAVVVSERYADGAARRADLAAAHQGAAGAADPHFYQAVQSAPAGSVAWRAAHRRQSVSTAAVWTAASQFDARVAHIVIMSAATARWAAAEDSPSGPASLAARTGQDRAQAELLREIFGNPFRPTELDPTCRTSTVLSLARSAYEERLDPSGLIDPARLAVLSDALEDAGCANDLLTHLRSTGPHVRGCWALDLILGKE